MEQTTPADLEAMAAEQIGTEAQKFQEPVATPQVLASNDSSELNPGVKRSAEDELQDERDTSGLQEAHKMTEDDSTDKPMSKNQLRKIKRQKLWEEKKADRRDKRREKRHNQQERKRLEKEAEIAQAAAEGRDPVFHKRERNRDPKNKTQVPISIIIDCQYEEYMFEKEQISLSSQVTRSYSDNRTAQHPVHLCVSSFGGKMKERFDTTLVGQYHKWKGITFAEEDFVGAAKAAKDIMAGGEGGTVIDLLKPTETDDAIFLGEPAPTGKAKKNDPAPEPEPEAADVDKSIVYLTADSPYVLDRLEPNTSYVIGGIIDRNRHKGLCYKVARERNVRTAKLPIGEYMVLQDRHVLATNHVVEIMLRWLELGDWGEAFMKVIPQRKGGKLKGEENGSEAAFENEEPEGQEEQAEEEESIAQGEVVNDEAQS